MRRAAWLVIAAAAGLAGGGVVATAGHTAPTSAAAASRTARHAAPVVPTTSPDPAPRATTSGTAVPSVVSSAVSCAHHHGDQYVLVSIEAQRMTLCAHAHPVREFPVTTGRTDRRGDATPKGTFHIQGRNKNSDLRVAGRDFPVRYWIPFHAPDFGFHDASWQRAGYGSNAYRTQGSHGCVHMRLADITWFYRWIRMGTTVRVS